MTRIPDHSFTTFTFPNLYYFDDKTIFMLYYIIFFILK